MGPGPSAGRSWLARAMSIAAVICLATSTVLIALTGDRATQVGSIRLGEGVALGTPWLMFSLVGAIIVRRRPDNVVGWLCSVGGLQVALVALAVGIGTYGLASSSSSPAGVAGAWLGHVGAVSVVAVPIVILYRFPTGRALGSSWRRAEALSVLYVGLLVALAAVDPMPLLTFPSTPNPLALGVTHRLVVAAFAPVWLFAGLGVAALVIRYRRGTSLERRQLRLLAVAGVLVGLALLTMPITSPEMLTHGRLSTITAIVNGAAFSSIPVAIGVAIIRDQLYDIERIVNRTLVYAAVSAILAATYVVTVIGLTSLLGAIAPDASNTLATAASTLLVATLFRPVRARAQTAVDRRFDRERYAATQSIDSFARQVRTEVELDAIVRDLGGAVRKTVRPVSMACWIRMSR
jgi:hypothetical protein